MDGIPRWLLFSLISSALCILGALCVPLLSVVFDSQRNNHSKLVNYGLSLSAGSMVTTSLYMLLPRIDKSNRFKVFPGLLVGICLSFFLNYLVHAFASESLVHCADESDHDSDSHVNAQSHSHSHSHSQSHFDNTRDVENTPSEHGYVTSSSSVFENDPLVAKDSHGPKMKKKMSLVDLLTRRKSEGECCGLNECTALLQSEQPKYIACVPSVIKSSQSERDVPHGAEESNDNQEYDSKDHRGLVCMENNVGYDLENLSLYRKKFLSSRSHHPHESFESYDSNHSSHSSVSSLGSNIPAASLTESQNHGENFSLYRHHHHLETPFSKLLSIGMQTCLVLALHKFPEGFIIFYTNRSDSSKSLGFSIFLSLTIHNFVEGFAMTLPFYTAFENKWMAILITAVLGGGSQPLGALIGYFIFRGSTPKDHEPNMDLLLSITAGFLLVIGLQMFQTGIGFSDGHHHHQGEDDEEMKQSHSSGTNCLKWCCTGVLLILASALFT
ncbi:zrt3p [Saccharomyces arboricola H-6]|uniref:Zrt3p n=1 Tax=Saccharomyces arboricola (strain H-6 / AS 2.3317 / CBS 10644) TaxID=1160507 RepID=J8Q037_SACAR|nr:zrt3p [Saccharomyces arboricola H-6]